MLSFLPLVCGGYGHAELDRQANRDGQTVFDPQAGQTIRWSQRFSTQRGEGESGGQQRGGPSRWEAPPTTAVSDYVHASLASTTIRGPVFVIDAGPSLLILTVLPPASPFASDVAPTAPAIPDPVAVDANSNVPLSPSHRPSTIPAPMLDTELQETPQGGESVSIDRDDARLVAAPPHPSWTLPATRLVASTLPAFDEAVSFIQPLWLTATDELFRQGWHLEDDLMDDPAELLAAPRGETRQVSLFEDSEVAPGHLSLVTGHGEARPGPSDEGVDAWFARTNDPLDRNSEPMIELAVSRELDAQDFQTQDFKAVGEAGQIDATHGVEYLRAEEGRAVYQVLDIAVAVEETSLEAAPPDDATSPLTKAILLPGLLAALLGRRRRSTPLIVA